MSQATWHSIGLSHTTCTLLIIYHKTMNQSQNITNILMVTKSILTIKWVEQAWKEIKKKKKYNC